MQKIEVPTTREILNQLHKEPDFLDHRDAFHQGIYYAIKHANDQLAAQQSVEPWGPTRGMKCAFWNSDAKKGVICGVFEDLLGIDLYMTTAKHGFYHCAQLDTIDEIGKPPSYFIERDHRHI